MTESAIAVVALMVQFILISPFIQAQSIHSYKTIRVRQDSFYEFDTTKTRTLSNCANICTTAIKKGKRVQGFVYRSEEQICSPTEFAEYEIDDSGMKEGNWTEGFIMRDKLPVRENYGESGIGFIFC